MNKNDKKYIVIVATFVLIVWLGTFLLVRWALPDWAARGQFGDIFGSVNALFSGFAFAGLIYAILLQHKELGLQREELRLQREEMKKSRKELAPQADLQRQQVLVTIAELRMRVSEMEIAAIEYESKEVQDHARTRYAKPIRALKTGDGTTN